MSSPRKIRIAIINPNSNEAMTKSLRAPIDSLQYNNTEYVYYTGPAHAPYSINSPADATESALALLSSSSLYREGKATSDHDAFLVACYSPHPLVRTLQERHVHGASDAASAGATSTVPPVLGIFEASVMAALQLLLPVDAGSGKGKGKTKFGIVTTGAGWKDPLTRGVLDEPLCVPAEQFAGVECCGVDAGDLHDQDPAGGTSVEDKVKDATGRLLRSAGSTGADEGKIGVIILGCAGMAGMDGWVRDVAGPGVRVVDGVKAGVGMLQALVRGGF